MTVLKLQAKYFDKNCTAENLSDVLIGLAYEYFECCYLKG